MLVFRLPYFVLLKFRCSKTGDRPAENNAKMTKMQNACNQEVVFMAAKMRMETPRKTVPLRRKSIVTASQKFEDCDGKDRQLLRNDLTITS